MGFEVYRKDGSPMLKLTDNVAALLWSGYVPALNANGVYLATTIPDALANNQFFISASTSGLPNLNTKGIKPIVNRVGNDLVFNGGQFGTNAMYAQVFVR
jgi:hypothetical protein